MTLNEILKSCGVADDVVTNILNAMKENKVFTAGEENLDIRYGKLKTDHDGLTKQLEDANKLIEDLKKSNKGNDDLQGKVSAYETQVAQLQEQLKQTQIESAIKVGLLSAKAIDVDYVTFKLKEKGALELDENGHIKGWEDKLAALKTQLPGQFEGAGSAKYQEQKLPDGQNQGNSISKEEFNKMGYQDRLKVFKENPEAYAELNKD